MSITTEVQLMLGFICVLGGSYWTYVIWKIDRNQSRLFGLYDELSKQVNTLQGEHNVALSRHLHDKKGG